MNRGLSGWGEAPAEPQTPGEAAPAHSDRERLRLGPAGPLKTAAGM